MATGNREIDAIRIYNRGRVISAYLHTDGQYYDAHGDSLQRAFYVGQPNNIIVSVRRSIQTACTQ